MRYALRNQDKIASVFGEEYLKNHIIESLNCYFSATDNIRIENDISQERYVIRTGEDYPLLRINDISDHNCMLEFVVIDKKYDILKLAFLGRMEC